MASRLHTKYLYEDRAFRTKPNARLYADREFKTLSKVLEPESVVHYKVEDNLERPLPTRILVRHEDQDGYVSTDRLRKSHEIRNHSPFDLNLVERYRTSVELIRAVQRALDAKGVDETEREYLELLMDYFSGVADSQVIRAKIIEKWQSGTWNRAHLSVVVSKDFGEILAPLWLLQRDPRERLELEYFQFSEKPNTPFEDLTVVYRDRVRRYSLKSGYGGTTNTIKFGILGQRLGELGLKETAQLRANSEFWIYDLMLYAGEMLVSKTTKVPPMNAAWLQWVVDRGLYEKVKPDESPATSWTNISHRYQNDLMRFFGALPASILSLVSFSVDVETGIPSFETSYDRISIRFKGPRLNGRHEEQVGLEPRLNTR